MITSAREKLEEATRYVDKRLSHSNDDIRMIINDAANIYSDNYEEYMKLTKTLKYRFRVK